MDPAVPSSTQSLDRALALLDVVVGHARSGIDLGALAEAVGLSKPTAHRLLLGLRNGGLVDYNTATRSFTPSFKLYRMGLASGDRFDVARIAQPGMERLAVETGDTLYLSIPSGDQAVCVARSIGSFPIKTLTLGVGDARPLGLGAGSLALLAALPDKVGAAAIARNAKVLENYPHFTPTRLQSLVARTRKDGYALNQGMMLPDMAAIAMAIHEPGGMVVAAMSIAAIKSRMVETRRQKLLLSLRREVRDIERLLARSLSEAD